MMDAQQTSNALFDRLQAALEAASGGTGRVTIAYSGGLDSRFLAFCAVRAGFGVRLLHAAGAHVSPEDTREALELARAMGLEAETVRPPLASPATLARAGRERCYVCKKAIFAHLKAMAEGGRLCDGTNASDRGTFRPGARALAELGVHSPLAEAGFEKPEIRRQAAALGLPLPGQAARPCLLTRFPYGVEPSAEALRLVADVEAWLAGRPAAAGLSFRLRFPDGRHPALHLERAGLEDGDSGRPEAIRQELLAHFGAALEGLTVTVMDRLSGYYDRIPIAAQAPEKARG